MKLKIAENSKLLSAVLIYPPEALQPLMDLYLILKRNVDLSMQYFHLHQYIRCEYTSPLPLGNR